MILFQSKSCLTFFKQHLVVDGVTLAISFFEFLNDVDKQVQVLALCKTKQMDVYMDASICYLEKTIFWQRLTLQRYRLAPNYMEGIQQVLRHHHFSLGRVVYGKRLLLDRLYLIAEKGPKVVSMALFVCCLMAYLFVSARLSFQAAELSRLENDYAQLQQKVLLDLVDDRVRWADQLNQYSEWLSSLSKLPTKWQSIVLTTDSLAFQAYVHVSKAPAWQAVLSELTTSWSMQGEVHQQEKKGNWQQWEGSYARQL